MVTISRSSLCGIAGLMVLKQTFLFVSHMAQVLLLFPTVHWGAIETNGTSTKKQEWRKKKKGIKKGRKAERKCVFPFQKSEITRIQSASSYCPNIYSALSLSVVLRHSHSLRWNPCCHEGKEKKNKAPFFISFAVVWWSQEHIKEQISKLHLKLHKMFTESHIFPVRSLCFLLFLVRSIRSHFG